MDTIKIMGDNMNRNKSGMIVYFDASNSGTQILGLSTNCQSSMTVSNVIKTVDDHGQVVMQDTYLKVTDVMYEYVDSTKTVLKTDKKERRKQVKHVVMTVLYGSTNMPKQAFGEGTDDLHAFYQAMHEVLPGPMKLMELMQSLWDPRKKYLSWEIDGVHAHIAILDKFEGNANMTIDGKDVSIPFQTVLNQPKAKGLSIAANVTHFVDSLIKDRVVAAFEKKNKPISTIHDDFGVHPNDVEFLMERYREALHYVYKNNILQNILRQLSGNSTLEVPQESSANYGLPILTSKYALS